MLAQLETLATIRPKDAHELESDTSSTLSAPSVSTGSKNSSLCSEFQTDPLAVWAVQCLHEEVIRIPNASVGFDQLVRSIERIKGNIRTKTYGQRVILAWDAQTTALSSMTLKDFLRAINSCFFSHFPDLHQSTTVLLLQWNNQKSALKTVLDTPVQTCTTFSIRKILDNKRFELERKGQVQLEGLSSKTRSLVLKAIQDSTSSSRGKSWRGSRGHHRGSYRNHFDRSDRHYNSYDRGSRRGGGGGGHRGGYKNRQNNSHRDKNEKESHDSQNS